MHIILNGKNDNWNYIGKLWFKKSMTKSIIRNIFLLHGLQIYTLPIQYKVGMINVNLEILEKHVKLSA